MLSLESQRIVPNLLLFFAGLTLAICFAIITNHGLITGPSGNSEFCLSRISAFLGTK